MGFPGSPEWRKGGMWPSDLVREFIRRQKLPACVAREIEQRIKRCSCEKGAIGDGALNEVFRNPYETERFRSVVESGDLAPPSVIGK